MPHSTLQNTLDFAADLGADPSGEALSDDALAALNNLRGSIRVQVPPGEYRFSESPPPVTSESASHDRRVFEATDGRPAFVAPAGTTGRWLTFRADGAFRGIDFIRGGIGFDPDEASIGPGSPEIWIDVPLSFELKDVEVRGREYLASGQGNGAIRAIGQDESATVMLEGVRIPRGTTTDTIAGAQPGVAIDARNKGIVRLRGCRVEECSSHGVDAARSVGPVVIEGGLYANNNRSQIRFCGPENVIEGATVGVDFTGSALPATEYARTAGVMNEALTPRPGARPPSGGEIRETAVHIRDGPVNKLLGAYYGGPLAGGMSLRECDLVVDVDDVPAIDVAESERIVDSHPPEEPLGIDIRRTACRGESSSGLAVRIDGRPDSVLQGSCISLPGSRRAYEMPRGASVSRINSQGACTGPPR